jgi:hypothetical protein
VTWFSWIQSRAQVASAAVVIAVVAAIAGWSGPGLVRLYRTDVTGCGRRGDCQAALAAVAGADGSLRMWLGVAVTAAPAIIGMFWGAPLVAGELQDGTFRLAWTQSLTRTRWLAVRMATLGLAAMAAAGLLSLLVTWWASPLDQAGLSRFGSFGQRDLVPVGYAAFAFALGVTAGLLTRRTMPAMLGTLAAFIGSRLAVTYWVRPHLLSPATELLPVTIAGYGSGGFLPIALLAQPSVQFQPPDIPNAWITAISVVSPTGQSLSAAEVAAACPGLGQGPGPGAAGRGAAGGGLEHVPAPPSAVLRTQDCSARLSAHYHELVSYQPGSRYWPLQWYELALFLAAALALAGVCLWRIRRVG